MAGAYPVKLHIISIELALQINPIFFFTVQHAKKLLMEQPGNTKGIAVPLTSCLVGFGLVCFANKNKIC
jgi:hypothetical protein